MFNIEHIANYNKTKEIIEKYSFYFKKNFGQNFLIDKDIISKIISVSDISKSDLIIEIGPGIGSLTQALAEKAGKVIAIEIDKNLIPILSDTLANYSNIEIINEDILKANIDLIIEKSGYKNVKVVANLPYYITTPIIMTFLENKHKVKSITVMVQKEVAERIKAKPSTKAYGSLSLAVQYYANVSLTTSVPKSCFIPRPNVDSSVLHLVILTKPSVQVTNEELMFKIIRYAFAQRRKTLVNSIYNMGDLGFTKEELINILKLCNLDEKIRGEALSLSQYAVLSDKIQTMK